MDEKLLQHLSCPFCGGGIEVFKNSEQERPELSYGVLICTECDIRYPVVEGIPIMMPPGKRLDVFVQTRKNGHFKKGIPVREICKALENGEIEKVKQSVVYSIPYQLFFALPKYADMVGHFGKRAIRKIMRSSYFDGMWTQYAKNILENDNTTYREALKLYYQDHGHFNYFFYKFGQPRFLTTLSLASVIDSSQKPVLDLACGQGHLVYFLTQKYINRMAIGVDRNFFQLILAKKYIAPGGQYICAEADEKLPFGDDTFGGIICADAFPYFPKKVSCIRDLKEIVTDNGIIILNRTGNKYLRHHVGSELTPKGYLNLFNSMPARMIGENSLLESYLDKRKPDLSQVRDSSHFKDQKWLTIVASNNKQVFSDHGCFDEWPHRMGKLHLNPHYHKTGSDNNGNVHYKFSFPSDWYAFENSLWHDYAPKEVTIPKDLLHSLNGDKTNPEIEKYIDEFVIMGFPENYM